MTAYDLIVKNAMIVSMEEGIEPFFGWIGIKNSVFISVERGECPVAIKTKETIDASGTTVLPGLTDCHLHGLSYGLNLTSPNLEKCTTLQQVLDTLELACAEKEGDSWVYGFGYLVNQIEEGRFPTRFELDAISHGHKVAVFAATMHAAALNSQGAVVCDVSSNEAGVVLDEDGTQLGQYLEDDSALTVSAGAFGDLSEDEMVEAFQTCCSYGASKGATSLHILTGESVKGDKDFHVLHKHRDEMPVDVTIWWQNWSPDEAKGYGLKRVGGCLTLDGATVEYTQANYKPFAAAPHRRGSLYHTDDEVYKFISRAWELDMQPTMHAVGERAVDQLLYAYLRVIGEQGQKDLRPRLEHFCQSTEEQVALAKKLGVTLSMQPGFSYYWDAGFRAVLGEERSEGTEAYGRVVRGGVTLLGGSDAPVSPIEPLLQIATLVAGPDERRHISVTDALKAYTVNPAWSEHAEDTKGSIEVGKYADMVIIDRNPYECDEESIFDMKVIKTICRGVVAYSAE